MSAIPRSLLRSMSSKTPGDFAPSTTSPGFFSGLSLWEKVQGSLSWLPTWQPSSDALLKQAEQHILDTEIQSEYSNHYVPVSQNAVIRTITMEPDTNSMPENTPLVMVHGFGAGLLQFYKNLDYLHQNRRLLAFDLPGFGRSSRMKFPKDPEAAEGQFVDLIEEWRQGMGVEKFVLLGHSLGGYLATAYTIRYPERVSHLVLVDPWGFTDPPPREALYKRFSTFQKVTWKAGLSHMRPFSAVRAAGPWGPDLVKRMRKDLARTFGPEFLDYVYHCNARNPTGEEAFYNMQYFFAWSLRPMHTRLQTQLAPHVPITIISGGRSWLDALNRDRLAPTRDLVKEARPEGAYVGVEVLEEAGHHLHAERPQEFNRIVQEVLSKVDSTNRDTENDLK